MISEDIESQLRDTLVHLHDPDHAPSEAVCQLLRCEEAAGALAVQSAAIRAIQNLEPPSSAPASSQTRLAYELLHMRFVMKLTQEETAYRMHMSLSTIRRAQRAAVHTLARVLWERARAIVPALAENADVAGAPSAVGKPAVEMTDWRSQMQREMAVLRARSPDAVSDVAETIGGALDVARALTSAHGVRVTVGAIQPGLVAAIHPTAMRQILIAAIGHIARLAGPDRETPGGEITLFARLEEGNVRVSLASTLAAGNALSKEDLLRDIPAPEDVLVDAHVEDANLFLWVTLPSVGRITVLVVDDNWDMGRFFRRATEGTSYHIVHVSEGLDLFEAITEHAPEVIVLDVMLPDVDGWELLMRLHEDRATREIPVIVCSVVREEELALSLGAAAYLAKPVLPREFIEALDRGLHPRPAAGPTVPANSAATC